MRLDDARRNELIGLAANESSSPFTSAAVNLANYSHCLIYGQTNTGAGDTITLEIEDSADGTTFAATACPSIVIGESSGLVAKYFHINAGSVRQYIRLKSTLTGSAVLRGAGAVLMNNSQSAATAPDVEY